MPTTQHNSATRRYVGCTRRLRAPVQPAAPPRAWREIGLSTACLGNDGHALSTRNRRQLRGRTPRDVHFGTVCTPALWSNLYSGATAVRCARVEQYENTTRCFARVKATKKPHVSSLIWVR